MGPAARFISLLGGLAFVANVTKRSPHRVHRWRVSREKGGTDGFFPREQQFAIHASLLRQGVRVSAEEIIYSDEQQAEIHVLKSKLNLSQTVEADDSANASAPTCPGDRGQGPNMTT